MAGCMLPMPFLCLCEHVAFARAQADTSVCTRTDTHTDTEHIHKMLQAPNPFFGSIQ